MSATDLNVPDPKKPCVPLPALVVVTCPGCGGPPCACAACDSVGSVLVDQSSLKIWKGDFS